MTADIAATTRRIFSEVFSTNKIDRLNEFADQDLVVHYAGSVEPLRGIECYKAAFARDIPSFPDARYTVEDIVSAHDRVAVRWRMDATHQGTYQGIAPTGKRVTLCGMSIYRFMDGKVVEGWAVIDNLGFKEQLGPA